MAHILNELEAKILAMTDEELESGSLPDENKLEIDFSKIQIPEEKKDKKNKIPLAELHNKFKEYEHDLVTLSYALYPDYFQYPPSPLHYKLSDFLINDKDNLVLAYPRDYGKSTYCTTFMLTYAVIFAKMKYIVYIGTNEAKAQLQLQNAVIEITSHPILKQYIKKIYTNNVAKFEFESVFGGRILFRAFGAGVNLRGERYLSSRPDLIIIDDMEDAKDAKSPTYREEIKRWFFADVIPMTNEGRILVIGTVVHFDSLIANLIDNPPQAPKVFKAVRYGILDDEGNSTWEEKFPKEKVEAMLEDARRQNTLDIFYMERMNIPVSNENQKFKSEQFKYISLNDYHKNISKNVNIFMSIDLASSESKTADYTAIVIVAVNPDNHWFVIDCIRGRWSQHERIKRIFEAYRKYKPLKVGIERGIIYNEMKTHIQQEMLHSNTFINFELLDPFKRVSKEDRILEALSPRYEMGTIWHLDGKTQELETELLTFPKSRHDDLSDALAYINNLAYPPMQSADFYGTIEDEYDSPYII